MGGKQHAHRLTEMLLTSLLGPQTMVGTLARMLSPLPKRKAVAYAREVRSGRACSLLSFDGCWSEGVEISNSCRLSRHVTSSRELI
ncbi:hypothetical protein BV22DRAFT_1027889 [Leucogyrophana mollusca]|uniref:Uncharacterized protein n=1 Tax=Leucogyrophana mollusca TaxID=85980 RepID=A0ACB8BYU0_9AGAM|nr:hypothetical protein BV22DRAFT_1027889 [Leucogyrophana mollusca]